MSELKPSSEMTPEQKRAMDAWLSTATLENNFKTITDRDLSDMLRDEHSIEASKSTIERWRNKFNWNGFLEIKIASGIVNDEEMRDKINKAVDIDVAKQTLVDVQRNGKLNALAYTILELKLETIAEGYKKNSVITIEDAKFVKDVAMLTSGREDRLMDRAALMGAASKVSRDEFLNAIANTALDIEDITEAELGIE